MESSSPSPDGSPRPSPPRKVVRRERPSGWLLAEDRLRRNRKERRARYLSHAQSLRLDRQRQRIAERHQRELRVLLRIIVPIMVVALVYLSLMASPTVAALIVAGLLVMFSGFPSSNATPTLAAVGGGIVVVDFAGKPLHLFLTISCYSIRNTTPESPLAMRVLLIEDEAPLAEVVKMGLEAAHYRVDWFENGRDGFAAACEEPYDIILLDLMLPGMDGWTVCRRLRDRRTTTPILMMTALGEVDERVRGLDLGADDYLPKPFAFPELRARIAALTRRDRTHRRRVIKIDDLEIDTQTREVLREGRRVNLTPREYDLLHALATNEDQVVTREMILERFWTDGDLTMSNTVDVHVGTLRKKIDSDREIPLIHTVHRRGYLMRRPEKVADVPVASPSEKMAGVVA